MSFDSDPTKKPALALSRGLERDRAVDETGHQIAILGRLGSRPLNAEEMNGLYLDDEGKPWFVTDEVDGPRGKKTQPVPYRPNIIWPYQPEQCMIGRRGVGDEDAIGAAMDKAFLEEWLAQPEWNFEVEDLRRDRDFLLDLLSEEPVREATESFTLEHRRESSLAAASEPEAMESFELVVSRDRREARQKPPPWLIGFAESFLKETRRSDRKLLGRVLEALEELSAMAPPLAPKGDTFKRLTGDLDGFWRYRIGDHRIIVRPDHAESTMIAVSFGPRGSIYD
ncbi:MAG TPA: type II toxin-antitoxin system RelE/ParE family toxin [Xanthomonadaceae bacterium]|nr:type II toxin-antitoxin system RelE/ParE family toxin [Xanthomonadaceae bacterium]